MLSSPPGVKMRTTHVVAIVLAASTPAQAFAAAPPAHPGADFFACATLTRGFVPTDDALGIDASAARLALARQVTRPVIRDLRRPSPQGRHAELRRAVNALRRWESNATSSLAAYTRSGNVAVITRSDANRQQLLYPAARALGSGAAPPTVPCPLALPAEGTATPGEQVALAMEATLVAPASRKSGHLNRMRSLLAAPGLEASQSGPARVILAALQRSRDPAATPAARAAAAGRVEALRLPVVNALLATPRVRVSPEGTPPPGYVESPDLTGLTIPQAYEALRTRGLHLMLPSVTSYGLTGTPTVIDASTPTGNPVRAGATVTVAIKAGLGGTPAVSTTTLEPVPDLVGKPLSIATATLQPLALPASVEAGPLPPSANAATFEANYRVLSQSPVADTVVGQGSPVTLRAVAVK